MLLFPHHWLKIVLWSKHLSAYLNLVIMTPKRILYMARSLNTKFLPLSPYIILIRLRNIILHRTKWIGLVWFMVFNATFYNISVISWRSVLLVEDTWVPRENHRPAASHWQTLSHNTYHVYFNICTISVFKLSPC